MNQKAIDDAFERVKKSVSEYDSLLEELGRSLELMKRFPNCFEHGKPTVKLVSKYPHVWPVSFEATVTVPGLSVEVTHHIRGADEPGTILGISGVEPEFLSNRSVLPRENCSETRMAMRAAESAIDDYKKTAG